MVAITSTRFRCQHHSKECCFHPIPPVQAFMPHIMLMMMMMTMMMTMVMVMVVVLLMVMVVVVMMMILIVIATTRTVVILIIIFAIDEPSKSRSGSLLKPSFTTSSGHLVTALSYRRRKWYLGVSKNRRPP